MSESELELQSYHVKEGKRAKQIGQSGRQSTDILDAGKDPNVHDEQNVLQEQGCSLTAGQFINQVTFL